MSVVICEDDHKCNAILDKSPRCLKTMIVCRDVRPATKTRAKNRGIEIIKFTDIEARGAKTDNPLVVS